MPVAEEGSADPEGPGAETRWGRRTLVAVAVIGVFALLLLGGRELAGVLPRVLDGIRGLGAWAAVAFIGIYIAATVAWVPGSILTLAAGAIFGLVPGTLYTLIGATTGALLAFLIARYLARGAVERRLGSSPRLAAVDRAVEHEGGKVVFLLRLSPVFPFNALNYALGLTSVRFRHYALASAIGMVPGTFMYVYTGYAAGEVAAGAAGATRGVAYYVLLGVGLLATVAVTVVVTRAARRALRRGTALVDDSQQEAEHGIG